jgi:hypothetical protein
VNSINAGYLVGDKVEALYKGKGTKWYSGTITRVNINGTYDIKYDDGGYKSPTKTTRHHISFSFVLYRVNP